MLKEKSGDLCPLFLGFYEESQFRAPHYQSVVPSRMNSVLRAIRDNEGFDLRNKIELPGQSKSSDELELELTYFCRSV